MKKHRVLAVIAGITVAIGLLLPVYSVTITMPINGIILTTYNIEYSLVGSKVDTKVEFDKAFYEQLSNIPKQAGLEAAPDDSLSNLNKLLGETKGLDIGKLTSENGLPIDLSGLPLDFRQNEALTSGSIPTPDPDPKAGDIKSILPSVPTPTSNIPYLKEALQFGPLLLLISPILGIIRKRYLSAAVTFMILVVLPLVAQQYISFLQVGIKPGGMLLLVAGGFLLAAWFTRRLEEPKVNVIKKNLGQEKTFEADFLIK